jgi:hypothetical protein
LPRLKAYVTKFRQVLSRLRGHALVNYVGLTLAALVVILATAIVATLTIDLGPAVRELAEREGGRRIERPLHIGRLSIHLLRGRVVVEDITIDGRRPGDRPFFTAAQLSVALDWRKALAARPEFVVTGVELTDWRMLVEKHADGHNFPKIPSGGGGSGGPRRFTTTVRDVRASRGWFSYEDHQIPWNIVAPNVDIHVVNTPTYHGEASFDGGTVAIQDFVPMWARMQARFTIDGRRLRMDSVDLETDGAKSHAVGEIDLGRWPEQTYAVKSRLHFPRMRELFFAGERWRLTGDGDFDGTFHLFKGGHELTGHFASDLAGVNEYRFPQLYGALRWTPDGFDVTDAGSRVFGGDGRYTFSIGPLGEPERPRARFDATYQDIDLAELTEFYQLAGMGFAGRATGHNRLEWPMGRFAELTGGGAATVQPPPGFEPMTATLDRARAADEGHLNHEWGPFAPMPLPRHVPIAAEVTYGFDPLRVEATGGRFATARTHVTFEGHTAWGGESAFRFEVTSADWQESDLVLAGLLTDFGAPTGPVAFGGRGEFSGSMSGPFRRPRVEGTFVGEDLRAWDTLWGDGRAQIVVENSYVTIKGAAIRHGESEIRAEGLFSLGYPRRDGGDEIDARFRVTRRDLDSLRHAFGIDDYPVSGLLSGEFHLSGAYEAPIGFGAMTLEEATAYGEPIEKGTAALRFESAGVRLDNIALAKAGGTIEGAAFVGWNSTYSFNALGRRIPMDSTALFAYPQAQPSGLIEFSASGSGTFEAPRYDVRFRVNDLFVAEEGVGQVTGVLTLQGEDLTGEINAASPRLNITGTGRVGLAPAAASELHFRFHDSSLDPYVRLFVPRLSPYTTAVATGAIRIAGSLTDIDRLSVDGTVDSVDMRLFDYAIRNASPVRLVLERQVVRVEQLRLVGEDTSLEVGGTIALDDERIALKASGEANLGILQGFFRDVRGAGRARLTAAVDGPLYEPVFTGSATIAGGRIRSLLLPNSLDDINGAVLFDARGLRLDGMTASIGGGRIQFGGTVGLEGYLPGELSVTARGEGMRLRYPEGVRSVVDADLSIRGNVKAPTIGGSVVVRSALLSRRVDPTGGLFDFGGGDRSAGEGNGTASPPPLPIRLDVEVSVPSTLRIENNLARLVASADLQLRGTYERPLLFGRAEVDRGEVMFEGRRYLVTHGAIEFTNPTRIEPFFDVEAETRVRVPGQTYRVIVRAAGTVERLQPELNSDPPLPAADVLALLFSDVRRNQVGQDVELRALRDANERQRDILTTRATQLLTNPISAEVGRVVEQTFGVDTFQLSPSFIDPYSQSTNRVNPSARVTIGKRISDRVYLTFSRSLNTSINDQILLLEYDESDRLSWILSRNEDQTYAIEVRVRHTF